MMETREYGLGTDLRVSYPWGLFHGGRAMCSDGKVRALHSIATTADTFFSVPASVVVTEVLPTGRTRRATVAGYITFETADGWTAHDTDDDPIVVKFVAYSYGRNGYLLPGLAWRREDTSTGAVAS